jgi:Glycosyltransferase family 87
MAAMSTSIRARRERRLFLVAFAAAVVGALLGINTLILHLSSDPLADIHAYYDAATRLNQGLPLYAQAASTNDAEFYRYPPLLAILFRPLATLPFEVAAAIWELLVIASFAATIIVLRPGRRGWLVFGMLALPIIWSLTIGQAQVPVTLLIAIGSPWSIALATNLKVFPALVAIWWVGRRDWGSLVRFAIWLAILGVAQLLLEPAGTLAYPAVFNLGQVGEVTNISPYGISPVVWGVLVVVGALAALRLAPTRWGWAAAVAFSVLASPRLLVYQLMTLVAGLRAPRAAVTTDEPDQPTAT